METAFHMLRFNKIQAVAAFLFYAIVTVDCMAQPSRFFDAWRWVEFDIESGLPSNHTYAILETEQGTPWVFTTLGVAWFDDYIWHQVQFPATVPLTKPQSFYADSRDRIVIVYDSTVFVGDTSGFERLSISSVQHAVPLPEGGLLLLRGELGKPKRLDIWSDGDLTPTPMPDDVAAGTPPGLWRTQSGNIWFSAGKYLFNWQQGKWEPRFNARSADFPVSCSAIAENRSRSGLVLVYRPFSSRGLWEWRTGGELILNTHLKGEDIKSADISPNGMALLAFESGYYLVRYADHWSALDLEQPSARQVEMVKFRKNGDLWMCTERGLRLFRYSSERWQFESARPLSPDSYVNDILLASDSSLWLATGAGLRVYKKDGRETSIRQLLGRTIYTATGLLEDREGNIWVCSGSDFQGAYRWNGSTWAKVGQGTPLGSARIHRMRLDNRGRVWLLGISKLLEPARDEREPGAFVFENGSITKWSVSEGLPAGRVYAFEEGADGSRWFGTIAGLSRWKNGSWQHWTRKDLFSAEKVFTLAIDREGQVWFSDSKGVVGVIVAGGNARHITTDDGLLDERVYEIKVDGNNRIWCTTPTGLAVYSNGVWGHFDEAMGIQNSPLWPVLPTEDKVFVGSHAGLTVLRLTELDQSPPRVELDPPMTSGNAALLRWKTFARWAEIPPDHIETRYRFDDQSWSHWTNAHEAHLRNLAPGDYKFEVQTRALTGGDSSSYRTTQATVTITIPLTEDPRIMIPVGISSVVLLGIVIGMTTRARREKQKRLREELRRQQEHSERLAQVDKLKSRFFANISHEFRTPLTLVVGPIGQALSQIDDAWAREKLAMAHRNAKKLHGLINQLLDFSKIESGTMKLSVGWGDVVSFVHRIVQSFHSWAEQKKQTLEFESAESTIAGYFDHDNLEKILNNIISNALKFTPEGGSIRIHLSVSDLAGSESGPSGIPRRIRISVADTGIGIAHEDLLHIFDRFYRVDESHRVEGSGIGLALTKELVELHHGSIVVQSVPEKGTEFIVLLPLEFYGPDEIAAPAVEGTEEHSAHQFTKTTDRSEKDTDDSLETIVLVVEDSADVRVYIKDHLIPEYSVVEAQDGSEGLAKARAIVPDLIISDVMMPLMDGYQLSKELKQDERTSHIPIILLTARAGAEDKVQGLELGADDYLTKPFDARELVVRIRNLIEGRRRLREKYSKGVTLKPGEVTFASMEDVFLQKAVSVVEECMSDEHFTVDQFSLQMNMSRMQLHRKLRGLTNQSATEFIRSMRLMRAHDMLVKNVGSISEIAYQTGFGSLTYFERTYRERFGYSPRETREKTQHNV